MPGGEPGGVRNIHEKQLIRFDIASDGTVSEFPLARPEQMLGKVWPSYRGYISGVWDTVKQVLLIFGGNERPSYPASSSALRFYDSGELDELWEYDPQAANWTDLTASSKLNSPSYPAARKCHTAVWDSTGRVMLVT